MKSTGVCVHVCMCVCVRERERERERGKGGKKERGWALHNKDAHLYWIKKLKFELSIRVSMNTVPIFCFFHYPLYQAIDLFCGFESCVSYLLGARWHCGK